MYTPFACLWKCSNDVYLDIDECQYDFCGDNEICMNTLGSAVCECSPGYVYNNATSECEGKTIHSS